MAVSELVITVFDKCRGAQGDSHKVQSRGSKIERDRGGAGNGCVVDNDSLDVFRLFCRFQSDRSKCQLWLSCYNAFTHNQKREKGAEFRIRDDNDQRDASAGWPLYINKIHGARNRSRASASDGPSFLSTPDFQSSVAKKERGISRKGFFEK